MRTRRRHHKRRTHKRRMQKGGAFPRLRNNAIQWPQKEGCDHDPIHIVLKVGDIVDRFGPPSGSYVSPVGDSVHQIANTLQIPQLNIKNVYTYSNRALPYAGVSSAGFENNSLRKALYNKEATNGANELGYHRYQVLKPNTVSGSACDAAPAFETPGGAIQIKLDKSVQEYLNNRDIQEINVDPANIPTYK